MNPPRLRLRKSEGIERILKRVIADDQISEQAKLAGVTSTLRELLGALGDRARVLGLRGGVLHVAVESSSALYEIRQFREQELLTALIQKFPKRHFRRLKLIVQPLREIEEE